MTVWGAITIAALFPVVGGGLSLIQRYSESSQVFARRVLVAFAIALLAMLVFRPADTTAADMNCPLSGLCFNPSAVLDTSQIHDGR